MKQKSKYRYDRESMQMIPVSWWDRNWPIVVGLGLSGIVLLILLSGEPIVEKKIVEGETVSTIIIPQPEFSSQLLHDYIEELNIRFPDIVYAQSKLETGDFNSTIFKENHNLFGMKCARSRPYTHKGSNRGHAMYDNWKESVIDYALYQGSYLRDLRTEAQYYEYIGNHYAEDPNYVAKVKKIVNKLRNE